MALSTQCQTQLIIFPLQFPVWRSPPFPFKGLTMTMSQLSLQLSQGVIPHTDLISLTSCPQCPQPQNYLRSATKTALSGTKNPQSWGDPPPNTAPKIVAPQSPTSMAESACKSCRPPIWLDSVPTHTFRFRADPISSLDPKDILLLLLPTQQLQQQHLATILTPWPRITSPSWMTLSITQSLSPRPVW